MGFCLFVFFNDACQQPAAPSSFRFFFSPIVFQHCGKKVFVSTEEESAGYGLSSEDFEMITAHGIFFIKPAGPHRKQDN